VRVGVLASGRGSNFEALARAARAGHLGAVIGVLVCDHADAGAFAVASRYGIPAVHVPLAGRGRVSADDEAQLVAVLRAHGVQLVCLAGFMRLVGRTLLQAFPHAVLNIHPALLPSFPGLQAARQAIEHGVKVSGCTVHFVTYGMDRGPIVLQAAVPVHDCDTPESLARRILEREHELYPAAVQLWAEGRLEVEGRLTRILPPHAVTPEART
jgi:phosphoribosylglycinamide formyltransferase-1